MGKVIDFKAAAGGRPEPIRGRPLPSYTEKSDPYKKRQEAGP